MFCGGGEKELYMQKLSVDDIVKNNENCYSFVIAIAKRARQISEKANDEEEILDEKPVQIAVQEFVEGKFRIVQKPAKDEVQEEKVEI
jgi:DNA-directed RNA polymerase subunit omega